MIQLIVKNEIFKEFTNYQDAGRCAFDYDFEHFMIRDTEKLTCERYDNPSRSEWFGLGVDYITLYGDEGDMD